MDMDNGVGIEFGNGGMGWVDEGKGGKLGQL